MKATLTERDLKFLVSALKQLERILNQKTQDEHTVERIYNTRRVTAILEGELLKV